jgi:hypothetical protein
MIETFARMFPDFALAPGQTPVWKPRGDLRALARLDLVAR